MPIQFATPMRRCVSPGLSDCPPKDGQVRPALCQSCVCSRRFIWAVGRQCTTVEPALRTRANGRKAAERRSRRAASSVGRTTIHSRFLEWAVRFLCSCGGFLRTRFRDCNTQNMVNRHFSRKYALLRRMSPRIHCAVANKATRIRQNPQKSAIFVGSGSGEICDFCRIASPIPKAQHAKCQRWRSADCENCTYSPLVSTELRAFFGAPRSRITTYVHAGARCPIFLAIGRARVGAVAKVPAPAIARQS